MVYTQIVKYYIVFGKASTHYYFTLSQLCINGKSRNIYNNVNCIQNTKCRTYHKHALFTLYKIYNTFFEYIPLFTLYTATYLVNAFKQLSLNDEQLSLEQLQVWAF